jgi:hypothetical protein
MTIIDKKPRTTISLGDVKLGGLFRYDGEIFLKCITSGHWYQVVRLNDGQFKQWGNKELQVEPVEGELHVN